MRNFLHWLEFLIYILIIHPICNQIYHGRTVSTALIVLDMISQVVEFAVRNNLVLQTIDRILDLLFNLIKLGTKMGLAFQIVINRTG